jgi:exopolysaccharide production protein ExoY
VPARVEQDQCGEQHLTEPSGANPLDRSSNRALKRTLDLVVAVAALTVCLPGIALLALLVKLNSRGPVLFGQTRVGRGGATTMVWKFRTMRVDAEDHLKIDPELWSRYVQNGFKLRPEHDPRLTRVGRWMRRFSLDELPQLWNVLKGEMSLVGPRPVLADELEVLYGEHSSDYLSVKPGLTGLWQVNGRSEVTGPARRALDVAYIREWGVMLELSILARTIPAVLSGRGAH